MSFNWTAVAPRNHQMSVMSNRTDCFTLSESATDVKKFTSKIQQAGLPVVKTGTLMWSVDRPGSGHVISVPTNQ